MPNFEKIEQGTALEKASKAMILLHGRGSNAEDILTVADDLADDRFYIVAPQAPGHQWYPKSFLAEEKENDPWLSTSIAIVKELLDKITKKIPLTQVYLMGFSQGACLSLETASRYATKYGGIVAFTGGLIGKELTEKNYHGNFSGTKVFISNGDRDPYIPLSRSEESKELMEKMGANVTLKVYPGRPHTINNDEINWVKTHILG